MEQLTIQPENPDRVTQHPRNEAKTAPVLTHDEYKAFEAACKGAPCNPAWSHAARRVYDGTSEALMKRGGQG